MRTRLGLSALPLLLALTLAARPAAAGRSAGALPPTTVTAVEVERERPVREKLPTLRFLRANRDFIRARFDRLRAESRLVRAGAGDVDPRFLEYRRLLTEIAAGKDSVTKASDARERQGVFTSVEDLAVLERELDMLEQLLDQQRTRLGALQADFAGRQRTELDVVLTGGAIEGRVDSVRVTLEDGTSMASSLTETQRGSLQHGGALEAFRGLVEPREQVIEIALMGEGWSATGHGFVTLSPARDRLTFLKFDLSQASPKLGIGSLAASTWLLETGPDVSPAGSPAASAPQAEADRDRP
jgi:hypothetical protein